MTAIRHRWWSGPDASSSLAQLTRVRGPLLVRLLFDERGRRVGEMYVGDASDVEAPADERWLKILRDKAPRGLNDHETVKYMFEVTKAGELVGEVRVSRVLLEGHQGCGG